MAPRRFIPLVLLLLPALLLGLPACSDDDDGTSPPGDTTKPYVLEIEYDGWTSVSLDAVIEVEFSEAMAPGSAAGNVTLSSGTITNLTWDDDTHLLISHGTWDPGVQVTVAVGTGLQDVAGNALIEARSASFWTASDDVLFLQSTPSDGADGVVLNVQPLLLFNRMMDLPGLQSATTVTEVGGAEVAGKTLHYEGDNWYRIEFDADLEATTTYEIAITTDAMAAGSTDHLAQAVSIEFTTGAEGDTTPPTLVSSVPASGTTIPQDQQTIVMNFSEPIDQNHARPTRIAAPLMAVAPGEPQWNAEGTQLTIYLRTPLPAGVRLFAVFEQGDFRDLNGNVNAAADSASLTVAGNVDYIPIHTDWQWLYERWGEENPVRKEPYEEYVKVQFENRSGSRFDWTEYRWDSYYEVWEESDRLYMEKNATGLYLRGFDGDGDDVTFSPSVVYQPLPFAVGDWDGTATASTGDGDAELAYEGEIVGQSIIVWENGGSGEPNLVWEGVWQSILHHQITAGLEVVEVGTDTLWYAPGLGLLQQYSSGTEETDEGTVQWWSRMRLEELWFDR